MKTAPVPNNSVPQLNMTSMIDVIFLLLIFFVFTADFDRIERLLPANLSLPGVVEKTETAPIEEIKPDKLKIRILGSADGISWEIDSELISSDALLGERIQHFAERNRQGSVTIAPDAMIPLEQVLNLYDRCRRAGLTQIQFAAKKQ